MSQSVQYHSQFHFLFKTTKKWWNIIGLLVRSWSQRFRRHFVPPSSERLYHSLTKWWLWSSEGILSELDSATWIPLHSDLLLCDTWNRRTTYCTPLGHVSNESGGRSCNGLTSWRHTGLLCMPPCDSAMRAPVASISTNDSWCYSVSRVFVSLVSSFYRAELLWTPLSSPIALLPRHLLVYKCADKHALARGV
jgi:hypothetical protein